eukprot:scaffold16745_cov69-Phaeocystis_antarctica.AAC.1
MGNRHFAAREAQPVGTWSASHARFPPPAGGRACVHTSPTAAERAVRRDAGCVQARRSTPTSLRWSKLWRKGSRSANVFWRIATFQVLHTFASSARKRAVRRLDTMSRRSSSSRVSQAAAAGSSDGAVAGDAMAVSAVSIARAPNFFWKYGLGK